jgi:hypothetical protein
MQYQLLACHSGWQRSYTVLNFVWLQTAVSCHFDAWLWWDKQQDFSLDKTSCHLFYPTTNLSFKMFPVFCILFFYMVLSMYFFLQNFQWHFYHDTHFANVLQMNTLFSLIHCKCTHYDLLDSVTCKIWPSTCSLGQTAAVITVHTTWDCMF